MRTLLDSRQMLAFVTLARRGSFTQAAKDLYLTQSAVSHAMKALEEDLGCRLFERVGKRVHLTQSGEQLLRHAERILREMGEARRGLEEINNWGYSRLRVGASTTACQYILPTVLREFKQSFPKCTIKIEPGDSPRQIELLRSNQIDLALIIDPVNEPDLSFQPLFRDDLRFLISPLHPWAVRGKVPRSELQDETLILYNTKSVTFRKISDYFRREQVDLNNFIELGSMEAIKELAKIGLGVGVLAPWVARRELEERSLISLPLGRGRLTRVWGVGHLKGRHLPLGEETFIGLCRSVTEDLDMSYGKASGAA